MQADGDLKFADGFYGVLELDLAFIDVDLVGDQEIGDIDASYRTVERTTLSGFAPYRDNQFLELLGDQSRALFLSLVFARVRQALDLHDLQVARRRLDCDFARDEIVAPVAW